ncbi:Oidioi.mRNA.OKI2018_I69.PAR.g9371.t2.cds [Oikopleura dioica]|uniref:Oidioi.mRNA.OKI2018_I69.PAR.g9371.t2.cds n=1 Tax=Oikopleura dioica TaxID=34765 RepID=A0ABN7RST1_OIKDI|nr:Oidioi.mRNA.OKI2018_I69.PAR.g9371.t2.cds [Oikopleura dioica]
MFLQRVHPLVETSSFYSFNRHSNNKKSSSSRPFLKRRGYGQLDCDDDSTSAVDFPELFPSSGPNLQETTEESGVDTSGFQCPALLANSPYEEPLLSSNSPLEDPKCFAQEIAAEENDPELPVFEVNNPPPPIPARQLKHSSTSSRDSPVPVLPGPPPSLSRRQNSRKDRKRPAFAQNNQKKAPPVRQISVGEQIFPADEVNRVPVNLSNTDNPFSITSRPISTSVTFESSLSESAKSQSSNLQKMNQSMSYGWSDLEKEGSETSEDGSSLLLPNKSTCGFANFSISESDVFPQPEKEEDEAPQDAFSSDGSDFEVADLDLSTEPLSTEGDEETVTEYGSTNNLAQFEPEVPMEVNSANCASVRPRPKSLHLPHLSSSSHMGGSAERISPGTPTPCSKGSTNDTLHSSGPENCGVDYLLNSLDDNENEMNVDVLMDQARTTSFSGFVKLKRSRKPRIKARQWVPVQISIPDKTVLIFSDDGRLLEEIDIHANQNVSAIQVEQSQDTSMPIYVVKLLRTFYKAKKLVGIGSAKNYSDFESSTAVYEKYATKVNQILKVGLKDYIVAHSFASLLSKTIKSSELASEDVEILASPVCRLIVDVFDEISCEINEDMEICAPNSSLETAIEVLAFSVDSATFELNQHSINEDSNELEETEINPFNLRIHPLAIPPEDEKYSYEETRTIKICPVNTARMEILRFNTAVDSFNLPISLKVDYTLSPKNFSIACSMHFDEVQASLKNVTIHLPMPTNCARYSTDTWFISNTVGKWKIEGDWMIWSIDSLKLENQEMKQQFLSAACRGSNSEKIPSQLAILQYEQLNETAASRARIKNDKIELQSQRCVDEDATVINYRSKYFAKVWIRLN